MLSLAFVYTNLLATKIRLHAKPKSSGIILGKSSPRFSIHCGRSSSKATFTSLCSVNNARCFPCQSLMVEHAPRIEGKIKAEETKPITGKSRVENQWNHTKPVPLEMAKAVTKKDCEVTYQLSRLAIKECSALISSRMLWY